MRTLPFTRRLGQPLPWRQFAVAEGDAAVMIHLMPELVQAIQESLDGADADGAVLVHSYGVGLSVVAVPCQAS